MRVNATVGPASLFLLIDIVGAVPLRIEGGDSIVSALARAWAAISR